jgi:hypothetical protein
VCSHQHACVWCVGGDHGIMIIYGYSQCDGLCRVNGVGGVDGSRGDGGGGNSGGGVYACWCTHVWCVEGKSVPVVGVVSH